MSESHSISEWIDLLREGDSLATKRIWHAFYERLVRAAARQLGTAGGRVADGEDVAADAFASFYRRIESGHFPDLGDRDGLWRLLLTIAERKAKNQIRNELAQKRGEGKVRGDSVFFRADQDGDGGGLQQFAGADPTPEDIEIMRESFGEMLQMLPAEQREIALLKMEAYTNREISDQVHCSVATVERRLRQIRESWGDLEVG